MAGFKVYTSNRMEILVAKLAEVLKKPLPSPFVPEIIIVQSRGMERWISMELARVQGVCANVRFPFPKNFMTEIGENIVDGPAGGRSFDPPVMAWRIMRLLPGLIGREGFEPLRAYLKDDRDRLKLYELAKRIAGLMDQYLVYRPDMLSAWAEGKITHPDEIWQAAVFRALIKETAGVHPAILKQSLISEARGKASSVFNLPERISIFGISSLPHIFMDIFRAVAGSVEVNLFLMNPCREFWFDIRTDRQISRAQERYRRRRGADTSDDLLYLERGNPLLSSLGTLGREFISYILDIETEEWDRYDDPGEDTVLAAVQSDILNLRDRSRPELSGMVICPDDESIGIHSCHSPMREVEVLYDHLLAMFEQAPRLLPKDILVMTPDIDEYAPYITAVFESAGDDASKTPETHRIPFSIADRGVKSDSRIANGFLMILDLLASRYSSAAVMSILELDCVHRRFGLNEIDVELIRHWIAASGIRWGMDERHRQKRGLPPYPENTWKAGLHRLLLGYAMPGEGDHLFKGILPYDGIEGEESSVLGKFSAFMDHLFAKTESLDSPGTLKDWSRKLDDLLETFFLAEEGTERDIQFIRRTVQDLGQMEDDAGVGEMIAMPVIRKALESALTRDEGGWGFMTGDVTFCAMLPMRSVPFKVICLLGMNNQSYPRQAHHLGFDLIAKYPRAGDRSRRNDDRYLFIEALLSARKRFYISYVGQSIEDNAVIPPSVLVSELMDYIEQGFRTADGRTMEEFLVTEHRLQAFNPRYFQNDGRLFSYSSQNCLAAAMLLQEGRCREAFIPSRLPDPLPEETAVDTDQLIAFFRNPARYLLEKRLHMILEEPEATLAEAEPFRMEGLDRYLLAQRLVEKSFQGHDTGASWPAFKAAGVLPHGSVGLFQYHELSEGTSIFVHQVRRFMEGGEMPPLDINLTVDAWTLTGRIGSIFAGALIHLRYADLKGKDLLAAWIRHLILNCMGKTAYPRQSLVLCRNQAWRIDPVEEAENHLAYLLHLYNRGLTQPLKFFPETSWHYAEQAHLGRKRGDEATASARRVWMGNDIYSGEGSDAAYRLCFRDADPIDDAFREVSDGILMPLVAHLTKI